MSNSQLWGEGQNKFPKTVHFSLPSTQESLPSNPWQLMRDHNILQVQLFHRVPVSQGLHAFY